MASDDGHSLILVGFLAALLLSLQRQRESFRIYASHVVVCSEQAKPFSQIAKVAYAVDIA